MHACIHSYIRPIAYHVFAGKFAALSQISICSNQCICKTMTTECITMCWGIQYDVPAACLFACMVFHCFPCIELHQKKRNMKRNSCSWAVHANVLCLVSTKWCGTIWGLLEMAVAILNCPSYSPSSMPHNDWFHTETWIAPGNQTIQKMDRLQIIFILKPTSMLTTPNHDVRPDSRKARAVATGLVLSLGRRYTPSTAPHQEWVGHQDPKNPGGSSWSMGVHQGNATPLWPAQLPGPLAGPVLRYAPDGTALTSVLHGLGSTTREWILAGCHRLETLLPPELGSDLDSGDSQTSHKQNQWSARWRAHVLLGFFTKHQLGSFLAGSRKEW